MNRASKRATVLTLLLAAVLALVTLGSASTAGAQESPALEFDDISDLSGKRLAVLNGGIFDQLAMQLIAGVSQDDILYFNSNAEAVGALTSGKADAFVTDSPIAELAVSKNDGIGMMPKNVVDDQYGYVLEKGSPYTAQLNERLKAYEADGTLERLKDKWTSADDAKKTMPEEGWDAPNGTLVVATNVDNEPVNYIVGDRVCGLCIELLELAARDLGYGIEYRTTNAASLIAEVQSGKADIAATSFSITDERKQMVDMTEPFYHGGLVVVVRTQAGTSSTDEGFFAGLAQSFRRTFVEEGRWQLILQGLGVTMLISVGSGALGLALGFAFMLLRRKKEDGVAEKLIHLLENLLGGLPVVVVLMVFYYVVFGGISTPGVVVAILAFTLIFGVSCGAVMWNAVLAVDVGQTEAGRALGFGDRDTFFLVVLPQAARQFAPLLVSQFVSLVKDTSVVGFIAVQDLTRVGDLIRARTMEAFFPLIAIAIIYFALCRVMAWLLNKFIVRRLEPKDGPRTIKGVELK